MFDCGLGSALLWLAANVAEDSVIAARFPLSQVLGVSSPCLRRCAESTLKAEDSLPKRCSIAAPGTISVGWMAKTFHGDLRHFSLFLIILCLLKRNFILGTWRYRSS